MHPEPVLEVGNVELVPELEPLYRELHRHHVDIATSPLVTDESVSWERRANWYGSMLAEGDGFIVLARRDGMPAGYAFVELLPGPDDTWPVGERYAEVQTLVVASGERGSGLGGQIMDRVEAELADRGVVDYAVGVLPANTDAIRFYERRGLVPAEILMWRFGNR
jgi:GNAT superfamily N-acetyltransferase